MYLSHFQTLQSWLSCGGTALKAFLCSLLFCIQNQSDESPLQFISYFDDQFEINCDLSLYFTRAYLVLLYLAVIGIFIGSLKKMKW